MSKSAWDRIAPAMGVVFVAFFVAAAIVMGSPPAVGDTGDEIASWFTDNRTAILTAIYLQGLGVIAFLWFLGSVANTLREAGEGRLAATAIAAATLTFAVGAASSAVAAALAFGAAGKLEAAQTAALYDVAVTCNVFTAMLVVPFVLAVAGGATRAKILPNWFGWLSVAVAIVGLVGGTTWASSGGWSPTGWYAMVTLIATLLWVVATSALLYQRASATEQARQPAMAS